MMRTPIPSRSACVPTPGRGIGTLDPQADWQFGQIQLFPIRAHSIAIEAGYTFNQLKFSPRAALGFDLASGSANPAHRFNQLFPPLYTYFGHLYLFGRENIIDLHPKYGDGTRPTA